MIIEGTTQIIDSGVSNSSAVRSLAEDEAVVPKGYVGDGGRSRNRCCKVLFLSFSNGEAAVAESTVQDGETSAIQPEALGKAIAKIHLACRWQTLFHTHTHRKYRLSSLAQQLAPPESSAGAGTPTTAKHVSELALAEADVAYQKVKQERQGVCGTRNRRAPV